MGTDNFYCRTKGLRRELIKIYKIVPLAHLKLVAGQTKKSAAGDKITDQYYCFSFQNISDQKENGTFFCGTYVARDFLEITNEKPLPLFNPFQQQNNENIHSKESETNGYEIEKWNKLAKEVFNAINILIMAWNTIPYGKLANIFLDLHKYPSYEPYLWKIVEINRIIGFDYKKRKLTEIVNDFCIIDTTFKRYEFPLMRKMLENECNHINI